MSTEAHTESTGAAAQSDSALPDAGRFWNDFLSRLIRSTGATRVLVLVEETQGGGWRQIRSAVARSAGGGAAGNALADGAPGLCQRLLAGEAGPFSIESVPGVIAARLIEGLSQGRRGAILAVLPDAGGAMEKAGPVLDFAVDGPAAFDARHELVGVRGQLDRVFRVVDDLAQVLPEKRFGRASIALCNALATDLGAEQVFLGWAAGGFAKVVAISRTGSFNPKMGLVQSVEKAVDECLDQDEAIFAPGGEDARVVNRDHLACLDSARFGHLLSVPLREGEEAAAVVTLQRSDRPFTPAEQERVRLLLDLAGPRLASLRQTDRWFGARMVSGLRRLGAAVVGPRHTLTKIASIAGAAALAFLIFYPVNYRVEGAFVFRSEGLRSIPAPFDGYLAEVLVTPGDSVTAGDLLARLDEEDLRLEREAAAAELQRYLREAEKARVARATADMRIAEALASEARARLEVTESRLRRSRITAPINGVVLEGDLRERIDSPVRQGEILFALAPPGNLFVEAEIEERDIHRVQSGAAAEFALVSRPEDRFPGTVTLVEPSGFPGAAGNLFTARIDPAEAAPWWRPGMSGVAKIEAGERSLLWVISHRTVDFLRMYFWM